jgi:hypothetical protein
MTIKELDKLMFFVSRVKLEGLSREGKMSLFRFKLAANKVLGDLRVWLAQAAKDNIDNKDIAAHWSEDAGVDAPRISADDFAIILDNHSEDNIKSGKHTITAHDWLAYLYEEVVR